MWKRFGDMWAPYHIPSFSMATSPPTGVFLHLVWDNPIFAKLKPMKWCMEPESRRVWMKEGGAAYRYMHLHVVAGVHSCDAHGHIRASHVPPPLCQAASCCWRGTGVELRHPVMAIGSCSCCWGRGGDIPLSPWARATQCGRPTMTVRGAVLAGVDVDVRGVCGLWGLAGPGWMWLGQHATADGARSACVLLSTHTTSISAEAFALSMAASSIQQSRFVCSQYLPNLQARHAATKIHKPHVLVTETERENRNGFRYMAWFRNIWRTLSTASEIYIRTLTALQSCGVQ